MVVMYTDKVIIKFFDEEMNLIYTCSSDVAKRGIITKDKRFNCNEIIKQMLKTISVFKQQINVDNIKYCKVYYPDNYISLKEITNNLGSWEVRTKSTMKG